MMQTHYQVSSGRSFPLGATKTAQGVNFALFSAHADKVELCLFDSTGEFEIQRIELPEFTDDIWHGLVEDLPVGTLYGYRVYGPFLPHEGHRFNPHKLLMDPYAKKLQGKFVHSSTHYSYDIASRQKDLTIDSRDNAKYLPKAVVIEPLEQSNSHPLIRRRHTTVYEMHVKGFTQLNEKIDHKIKGTFAALADDVSIQYLTDLGVNCIELLPVHSFIDESFVHEKGLSNFWGYNSINFFTPDARYSASGELEEFKACVERLHQANIEVILDVVYNHTAEGNELGPTLSYRGIDNASYYRLSKDDNRYYTNYSGCGNTLNISHPRVLQLVTDSLRYWVEVMGVDGFRFDLAPILGRDCPHFSKRSHFFSALRQDPVLSQVKLIAEPWDIGQDGYQLGRFPNAWLEWNDRFRDTVRRFWRGDKAMAPEFARRLHGSADIFEQRSRRPASSINFVTSHDGYTLHDLVTFEQRHNHVNGENNADGHGTNFSCNFGVEGETEDSIINQVRLQQKRNILATLFIAQGTPMLLAGDELGNSQQGNNNAYCQDNEISWIDWQQADLALLDFVKALIQLRKDHPLLNRTHYQHGLNVSDKTGLKDISWLNKKGQTMVDSDWQKSNKKCFGMLLADTHDENTDVRIDNAEHTDDAILVIFNAHRQDKAFHLPELNGHWQVLFNTVKPQSTMPEILLDSPLTMSAHSMVLLSFTQSPIEHTKETKTS
jgi:isoamylase